MAALAAPLLALAASTAAAADADPFADARRSFMLMYAATESGAPLTERIDTDALRDYPLHPYLERARIARGLTRAASGWTKADDEAREFLAAHGADPVATDLRRAWLLSLADRAQWQAFARHYAPDVADAALQCRWLAARIELRDTAGLSAAIADRWLTAERLPPVCEPVFEWLRAQNAMTDELIERRVRLLLENGQAAFARTIARRLPAERSAPYSRWAELLERPHHAIDAVLAAPTEQRLFDAALLAGWRKLARNDPDAALARHTELVKRLDAKAADRYTLVLALGLAWDRRARDALEAFADVASGDLDDYALGWRARAALWAGDWRQVERSIGAMSDQQRWQPRWRYWAARAAEHRGERGAAQKLYESVLATDNYYAANAAARLGRTAEPHPESLAASGRDLDAIASRPAFVRARELLLCGLRGAATAEWLAGMETLSDAERRQAIHLAARWQWHDVSVATATRQRVFFDYGLLYPRPYEAAVTAAAELTELDSPLLYGLIRQESLFRSDAVSAAGAIGLAQLLPETARIIARARQQPVPRTADLFDPTVNIKLGASHLKDLLDRFDDRPVVALAAYNAGALAAERWLPEEESIDADIWVENIPYNETRDYVQRVLWHSVVFEWLRNGTGKNVEPWLMQIAPRAHATGKAGQAAG